MWMWLMTYRMANWYCAHTKHLTLLPWLLKGSGEAGKLDDPHRFHNLHKKERRSVETPKRNFRGTDHDPRVDRGSFCSGGQPDCLEQTAARSACRRRAPNQYATCYCP